MWPYLADLETNVMPMKTALPHLIIGQGLAGSALAYAMHAAGLDILVVDDGHASAASKVAAGLFNPITGGRFARTWQVDAIFGMLPEFYTGWQAWTGAQFCFPGPIVRPFGSIEEQNLAVAKSADQGYQRYITQTEVPAPLEKRIQAPLGAVVFGSGGWVDVPLLLKATKNKLISAGQYVQASVNPEDIETQEQGGQLVHHWQGNAYASVTFCIGYKAAGQSGYDGVRFSPVRGEILTLKLHTPWAGLSVSKGIYVVGKADSAEVRVGATYNWREPEPVTSSAGRQELETDLAKVLAEPYEVVNHEAGVRPAVADRRPVLGYMPSYPHLGVLNGLGSKGTSLAPWLAVQWVQHLLHGTPYHPEVEINRFSKR